MVLDALMDLLPPRMHEAGAGVFFVIAGLGLIVGFLGARIHRSVIALSLVATGTVIGLHMPRWFGWGIDPMGTAFGAAIVLGGSGYILTTLWEGLFLGTILAALAGAFVWLGNAPAAVWHWPGIAGSASALEAAIRIWQSLPTTINRSFPAALGVGAVLGAGMIVISPRLGRSVLFGILATMIVSISGALGAHKINPGLLDLLPADPLLLAGIMGCTTVFFAGVQLLLLPKPAAAKAADRSNKIADDEQSTDESTRQSARPTATKAAPRGTQPLRPHKVAAFVK
jgi:hypothetical protein